VELLMNLNIWVALSAIHYRVLRVVPRNNKSMGTDFPGWTRFGQADGKLQSPSPCLLDMCKQCLDISLLQKFLNCQRSWAKWPLWHLLQWLFWSKFQKPRTFTKLHLEVHQ
jgi:hypothetical protein